MGQPGRPFRNRVIDALALRTQCSELVGWSVDMSNPVGHSVVRAA
jgi:hypothetical protein